MPSLESSSTALLVLDFQVGLTEKHVAATALVKATQVPPQAAILGAAAC